MDYFLRSLAQDQGEQAIGIVLSGTGSHGSLGIREIKHSGGMAMAQKPDTAEYDQMPIHAIGTGVIDYVLPPEQMPAALLSYLKQPYLRQDGHEMGMVEQESELLNRILAVLESQAKYDFRSYRKPMVLRRLQRRMGIAQIDNLGTGAQCEQLTHDLSHTLPGATNQNQEKTGVDARLRLARLHAGRFLHCG